MKINNPEFVTSAREPEDYPFHEFPEIALAGRSNVGKSALINKITNRKKLAYTSSTPGKTQSINFYRIDSYFYFVDLPGYGFAKVSKKEKEKWGEMIETYLFKRYNLAGVIFLVDSRHEPTEDDLMMYKWLVEMKMPTLIAATKVDKLKRSQRRPQEKLIKEKFRLTDESFFTFFSAKNGEGKKEVIKFIGQFTD